MVFLANAIFLGWLALIWEKKGALNISIFSIMAVLAVTNATLAAPTLMKWLGT